MFMPDSIAEVHNVFWNHFGDAGIPKVLENTRFMFIKDKEGYIIPSKIYVKLIYHPIYEYCFVGLLRKTSKVVVDDDHPLQKTRKTLQMICD